MLDSTVVFNEVMYNPAGGDEALEWIELHNQMAVDMDISGWSIQDGVQFAFPEGTILPGRDFLVIAAAPDRLAAATGFAGALGPFAGHLSNGGEQVELYNNSRRLMDSLDYGDGDPWPAAADGSGASLAKRDADAASGPAANWTWSREPNGTPGQANFPDASEPGAASLIALDASWRYEASGADLGSAWREPGYSDAGWDSGQALFYAGSPQSDLGQSTSIAATITADVNAGLRPFSLQRTSSTTCDVVTVQNTGDYAVSGFGTGNLHYNRTIAQLGNDLANRRLIKVE